jgi:tRNA pseudouridine55 synthase
MPPSTMSDPDATAADPTPPLRDGLAIVDKEPGWTSHDVVAKARGILRTKKIGHSGTLDPDATGVLLLGVGRATKLLRFLTALPKTYVGDIVLGTETSTLDAAGEITATHDMSAVTLDDVRRAARALTGDILQVPPMVSAVKIDGKRLHELARKGIEVDRPARPVSVYRFDVEPVEGDPGVFRASVDCSSGTYIRVLAADIGAAVGGGAHLRALRRTAIGSYGIDEATPLDGITVLPAREALRDYPAVIVRDVIATAVRNGKVIDLDALGIPDAVLPAQVEDRWPIRLDGAAVTPATGPWAVLDPAGELLAVYERHRADTAKPAIVVAPAAT